MRYFQTFDAAVVAHSFWLVRNTQASDVFHCQWFSVQFSALNLSMSLVLMHTGLMRVSLLHCSIIHHQHSSLAQKKMFYEYWALLSSSQRRIICHLAKSFWHVVPVNFEKPALHVSVEAIIF